MALSQRRISQFFRRGAQSDLELSRCYIRVFDCSGTKADAEIVLADMMNASGFISVSGPTVSAEARAFADGKRAVMARVLKFLNMPPEQQRVLEQAAQMEAYADMAANEATE